jgi:hypothetical protein
VTTPARSVLSVEDRYAIEHLYSAYNRYIDSDRIDEVELFAPDGVYVSSNTYAGRAALADFGRERAAKQATSPLRNAQPWNGSLLLEEDGDLVRGSCYLVVRGRPGDRFPAGGHARTLRGRDRPPCGRMGVRP